MTTLTRRYWLAKTEPEVYSYQDLEIDGETGWDGVRNYQARNNLKQMRVGDHVIVYHSNANPPAAAGVAVVSEAPQPDPSQFDPSSPYHDPASLPETPRWYWVRMQPLHRLEPVPLERLKSMPELAQSQLVAKGSRLSVIELTENEYLTIVNAGSTTGPPQTTTSAQRKTTAGTGRGSRR